MKRFSKTLRINQTNLKEVPDDQPGVIRIRNKHGKVLFSMEAMPGRLAEAIWNHRGGAGECKAALFQYRTTESFEEAMELRREETMKYILPFLKVR